MYGTNRRSTHSVYGTNRRSTHTVCTLLGTIIQETLNWTSHIDRISNKISRTLGVMNKLKHFLPGYTLKTLYNSLIVPHFNYSVLSWGFHTNRLSKLQKRAVIIISSSEYNSHTEPVLKYPNLLKIEYIFTRQCIKKFHKFTYKRVPIFFQSPFSQNVAYHTVIHRESENVLDTTYQLY